LISKYFDSVVNYRSF